MRLPTRPLVLGHRGAPREAPENTLAAFRRALALGADGVELDVQPAGDGTPVVIHDETLDRTTDGAGPLAARSWPALEGVRSRGEPLPRLQDAIRWAADAGAWLNLEIKAPGTEAAVLAALRQATLLERSFLSSFLPHVVERLRELDPDAACFLLTQRWDEEVLAWVHAAGVVGVCLHDPIATAPVLERLRREGLHAVVWTVDDPVRMRELFRAGVLGVISNLPGAAVEARRAVLGDG